MTTYLLVAYTDGGWIALRTFSLLSQAQDFLQKSSSLDVRVAAFVNCACDFALLFQVQIIRLEKDLPPLLMDSRRYDSEEPFTSE